MLIMTTGVNDRVCGPVCANMLYLRTEERIRRPLRPAGTYYQQIPSYLPLVARRRTFSRLTKSITMCSARKWRCN